MIIHAEISPEVMLPTVTITAVSIASTDANNNNFDIKIDSIYSKYLDPQLALAALKSAQDEDTREITSAFAWSEKT